MNEKITELFAFVCNEDGEGIVSMQLGDTHMPLIGADMERTESLRPYAKQIAIESGRKIQLMRFKLVSVEEI